MARDARCVKDGISICSSGVVLGMAVKARLGGCEWGMGLR